MTAEHKGRESFDNGWFHRMNLWGEQQLFILCDFFLFFFSFFRAGFETSISEYFVSIQVLHLCTLSYIQVINSLQSLQSVWMSCWQQRIQEAMMNISQALPLVCSFFLPFFLPLSLTHVPLSLSLSDPLPCGGLQSPLGMPSKHSSQAA